VVAYRNGAPVKLSDVASITDEAENLNQAAWMNDTPAVIVNIQRQPGANIISVVDHVKQLLPQLTSTLPTSVHVRILTDRTNTIRASVKGVQYELMLTIANIDAAARDVQAAINAARGYLPSNLPNNPTYRKVNPADAPILIMALTSKTLSRGQMYDAASSIMAQKLSQVKGVGQVVVGGSSLPAVRVNLDLPALNKYGVGLEQVRSVLAGANAHTPKGYWESDHRSWEVGANSPGSSPGSAGVAVRV